MGLVSLFLFHHGVLMEMFTGRFRADNHSFCESEIIVVMLCAENILQHPSHSYGLHKGFKKALLCFLASEEVMEELYF